MTSVGITFLGTGAGNCIHRSHTAIVLDCADGFRLLLDASSGNSVLRNGAKLGIYAEDFEHILLSHRHADHMAGLPHIQGRRTQVAPDAPPIVVHSLEPTIEGVQSLFKATSITHQVDQDGVNTREGNRLVAWNPIEVGVWRQLGADVRVFAFAVNHIGGAVGWRIETGGVAVVFSGDTRYSDNLIESAQGADLLIHEALSVAADQEGTDRRGHSTAAEAARAAKLAGVGQLILTHIDTPFHHDVQPLIDEARRGFDGPVSAADDLLKVTVNSR